MKQRYGRGLSAVETTELWDRWQLTGHECVRLVFSVKPPPTLTEVKLKEASRLPRVDPASNSALRTGEGLNRSRKRR